jgi:hypothetical protein
LLRASTPYFLFFRGSDDRQPAKAWILATSARMTTESQRRLKDVDGRNKSGHDVGVVATVEFYSAAFHSWPTAVLAGKISDLMTTGTAPELSRMAPISM